MTVMTVAEECDALCFDIVLARAAFREGQLQVISTKLETSLCHTLKQKPRAQLHLRLRRCAKQDFGVPLSTQAC